MTRVLFFLLVVAGCRSAALVVIMEPETPIAIPGVDSVIVARALAIAEVSFAGDRAEAERLAADGRHLARRADSLLSLHDWTPADSLRDSALATEHFNEGAVALESWSQQSPDSLHALSLLQQAAAAFEAALDADPFDAEIRYWLGHVLGLQAEHYEIKHAAQSAIEVLLKLVSLNQDRHDYIGLLARQYELVATSTASLLAGALWEKAARVAQDDVVLGGQAAADTAAVFGYLLRSSRSFGRADSVDQALRVLDASVRWAATVYEVELVTAERRWLMWDEGNLQARRLYDRILAEAEADPKQAAGDLEALLNNVGSERARVDVAHQLSLAWYATGRPADALALMRDLWKDRAAMEDAQIRQVRSDYAVMAYNLAQQLRRKGELTRALVYLLQCEELEDPLSASAALEAAQLLSNNPQAALERAHVAERRMEDLRLEDQRRLLRYMVDLHRRMGDRDRAREYFDRLGGL